MTTTTELRNSLTGAVLVEGDDGFEDAATGYQRRDPHRPDLVVVAADASDVAVAVRFAAEHGLPVAVQSSGHGLAHGLRGGLLISTRAMTGVTVDADARTARVAAGATWQRVVDAAAGHSLAPLSGSSPGVGVVGYVLGGGTGLLGRRYGWAADHVSAVDLVTPMGETSTVTADSDPELFWALRGGGGSFGIVTAIEIGLFPLTTVFGGSLTVDVAAHPDVLTVWRDWTADQPDGMTAAISVLTMPDIPPVPEPLRNRQIASVQIAFAGSSDDGAALVAPLRAALDPMKDTVRELPFVESGGIFDEPDRPHAYRSTDRMLAALPDTGVDALLAVSAPDAEPSHVVNIRHLGGAFGRAPEVPNAVGHRDAAYLVNVLAAVDDDSAETARSLQQTTLAALDDVALGTSLNFAYGPMSGNDLRAAFDDGTYDRLAAVARRCDPGGRLRPNHPVR